jgi:hypothetical protein
MTRNLVQKNQAVVLRAVADSTQAKIAQAMGGHEASYVSRFLKGEQKVSFDEMLVLLETCGLAVHRMGDADMIVDRADWQAMVRFAKRYMAEIEV